MVIKLRGYTDTPSIVRILGRRKMAKRDLHKEISENIISLIESEKTGIWSKDWDNSNNLGSFDPRNATTNKCYNGINRLILALTALEENYTQNLWVTYKQAQAEGWQVKKGSKGVTLCYYSKYEKDTEEGEKKEYFFLKSFTVFNVSQLDNYKAKFDNEKQLQAPENCEAVKTILANTDVKFGIEQGDKAFYAPSLDAIQMPPKATFKSESGYYATLLHELTHSTMHEKRLQRGKEYREKYSDSKERYAREELVAELGSAFLCAEIGCINETLENHASYLKVWLKVIKSDKKAIFKASSDAQKAADFILKNWAGKAEEIEEAV